MTSAPSEYIFSDRALPAVGLTNAWVLSPMYSTSTLMFLSTLATPASYPPSNDPINGPVCPPRKPTVFEPSFCACIAAAIPTRYDPSFAAKLRSRTLGNWSHPLMNWVYPSTTAKSVSGKSAATLHTPGENEKPTPSTYW